MKMEKIVLINSLVPYLTFVINNGTPLVDATVVYSTIPALRDKYADLIKKTYDDSKFFCLANNKEVWDTAKYQRPTSSKDTHYFDTLEQIGKVFDALVESEMSKLEYERARALEKQLTAILVELENGIRTYMQSAVVGSFATFFRDEEYVERIVRFLNVMFAVIGWDVFSAIQNHIDAGSHKYKNALHSARFAGGVVYVFTHFLSMSRLIMCYNDAVTVLAGIVNHRTFEKFLRLFCVGRRHRLDREDAKRLSELKRYIMIVIRDLNIQENENGN